MENAKVEYIGWVNEPGDLKERLIVGDRMPQSSRITFPTDPIFTYRRESQTTGSIGFLDFHTVGTGEVVRNEVERRFGPVRLGTREIIDIRAHTAIRLAIVGIEPAFMRSGYATLLFEKLEQIARDRKVNILVSNGPHRVDNVASEKWHLDMGFTHADRFLRPKEDFNADPYFPYSKVLS